MKRSDDIQILKQSLKRNRVRVIVWVLAIIAGLAIGGYAGVQAYYHGWCSLRRPAVAILF